MQRTNRNFSAWLLSNQKSKNNEKKRIEIHFWIDIIGKTIIKKNRIKVKEN